MLNNKQYTISHRRCKGIMRAFHIIKFARLVKISLCGSVASSLQKQNHNRMETLKRELSEYIATGYDFDAMMDLGNGWEPYEGCTNNLMMILEDPDTEVEMISGDSDLYKEGIRRYHITLPSWWRKGTIAISFDESELV